MAKESALCQLMKVRMNGVMNSITNSDGEYQEIIRRSDVYSDRLERMELPEEARLLIDRYVSEQNAHSTCTIDQGMGCSPTCSASPAARRCSLGNACPQGRKKWLQKCNRKVRTGREGWPIQPFRPVSFVLKYKSSPPVQRTCWISTSRNAL